MRKFIINFILFTLVLIILDRSAAYVLQYFRPIDYQLFLDSKREFFEKGEKVEILVIGDSHIADAIDPRTIETSTGLKAFNLGIYHSSPFENYYVTKSALEKLEVKPEIIVLGTNPVMFEKSLSKGKYTPLIIPFSFEFIRNSSEGFDGAFFLKTIQEKYLVNSLVNKLIGKTYTPTRAIEDVYYGHSKFFNQLPDIDWKGFEREYKNDSINKKQIEYFSKTIELAIKHEIQVVIVHPPIWREQLEKISSTESYDNFRTTIDLVSKKYNLDSYYDYVNNKEGFKRIEFQQKDFLNTEHLNYYGSQKFTQGFSEYLLREDI